jgi:hypothetical protein
MLLTPHEVLVIPSNELEDINCMAHKSTDLCFLTYITLLSGSLEDKGINVPVLIIYVQVLCLKYLQEQIDIV